MVRESRRTARNHMDELTRLTLLETDMDLIEHKLDKMMVMLWGVLVTAFSATVAGILNLVVFAWS